LHSFESKNKATELKERIIKIALIVASTISILTTFGILFSILFEAIEFFKLRSFWYFLTGTVWSPGQVGSQFGAVPIFAGTIMITVIALAVAIPIGLGSAIFMSEFSWYSNSCIWFLCSYYSCPFCCKSSCIFWS
jgi:phosphate transport system permease protein